MKADLNAAARRQRVLRYASYGLSPFLLLGVLSLILGRSALDSWPVWTDELDYWRSLQNWNAVGFATGYSGLSEIVPEAGTLSVHGLTAIVFYGWFVKLFGLSHNTIVLCNALWVSLGALLFCLLLKPKPLTCVYISVLLATYAPVVLYAFTSMTQLCQYGVLPLENSTAGSVNAVYDLMQKHNFSIVRSVRLRVDHSLLALPGVKLSEIREVVSHGQALEQCSEFLKQLPNVTVTRCENTAAAARMVAGAGRRDLAAIASPACAEIYGLQPLQERVQNEHGNYTRFICIAAKPEVYPGADRTSLLVTLSNEPGSLYQVLARIYGCGINLTKLESRPIPGSDDTFRFYFDLEASVYSPELPKLLGELESICEHVCYLGSYSETV